MIVKQNKMERVYYPLKGRKAYEDSHNYLMRLRVPRKFTKTRQDIIEERLERKRREKNKRREKLLNDGIVVARYVYRKKK